MEFFAKFRKSVSETSFPAFLSFGFLNILYVLYGFDIAAAQTQLENSYLSGKLSSFKVVYIYM